MYLMKSKQQGFRTNTFDMGFESIVWSGLGALLRPV